MKEKPEIVKELKNQEKLGLLQNNLLNVLKEGEEEKYIEDEIKNTLFNIDTEEKKILLDDLFSENIYKIIFECSPEAIAVIDKRGNLQVINSRVKEWVGYEPDELIGLNILKLPFLTKESRSIIKKKFIQRLLGQKIDPYELTFNTKEKKLKIGLVTGNVIKDSKDKTIGSVVLIKDITQQKLIKRDLKKIEDKYQDLFENVIDLIQSVDIDGKIEYVNKSWKETLGYNDEEIKNMNIFDIIHPDQRGHCQKLLKEILNGTKKTNIETIFMTKFGKKVYVEGNVNCRFENSKPVATRGIFRDVTNKKEVEINLRRFKKAIESSSEAIGISDVINNAYFVNNSFTELTGYTAEELNKKGGAKALYKEKELAGNILKKLSQGNSWTGEITILTSSGKEIRTEVHTDAIRDENNEITGFIAIHNDISEKLQIQQKLYEASQILNSSHVVTFLWKNEEGWPVEYVSPNVKNILGYSDKEFLNGDISYESIILKDDLERVVSEVKRHSKNKDKKFSQEYRIITKDKKIRWFEDKTVIRRDNKGVITHYEGIIFDITKEKNAENILKQSKKQMENILNAAGSGIRIVEKNFQIRAINKTLSKMTNTDINEVKKIKCRDFFKSEHCGTENCALNRAVKTGKVFQEERLMFTKDGKKIPCLTKITPLKNEDGEIIGIIEDYRDISSIKEAEQLLKEEEERFRRFFESSPDYCYMVDPSGKIIDINKSAVNILGYNSKEEIIGKQIIPSVYVESEKNRAKDLVIKWKKTGKLRNERIKIKSKNGKRFVLLSVDDVKDKFGKIIYSILTQKDITDIIEVENKLKNKLDELERYKKVTIGRELKMIELKKRIKELEGKHNNNH